MPIEDHEFNRRKDHLLGFLNHIEQFTNIELKRFKTPKDAIKHGYHKTSIKTAMKFFPGIKIEKLHPLLKIENDMVILNTKYNLYRGIHPEHHEHVRKKGLLTDDDTNKQEERGPVVRLTPHILEAAKYAGIKSDTMITGMIIEIEPSKIKGLTLGSFGFERFNSPADIEVGEYRIYETRIEERNPNFFYLVMLSTVLMNQGIDLEGILRDG